MRTFVRLFGADAAFSVMNQDDTSTENSYEAEVTSQSRKFALVRNPTDPNSPGVKFVLGVEDKDSAEKEKTETENKTSQERPPRPLPRISRPTCVPSTVARCFCTVDILYD